MKKAITVISVMADYCSTGLWDQNGYPLDFNEISLLTKSTQLKDKLEQYNSLYDTNETFLQGFVIFQDLSREQKDQMLLISQLGWEIALELYELNKKQNRNIQIKFFNELMSSYIILDEVNTEIKHIGDYPIKDFFK